METRESHIREERIGADDQAENCRLAFDHIQFVPSYSTRFPHESTFLQIDLSGWLFPRGVERDGLPDFDFFGDFVQQKVRALVMFLAELSGTQTSSDFGGEIPVSGRLRHGIDDYAFDTEA